MNADERIPPTSVESYLRAIERIPLSNREEERLLVERAFTRCEPDAVERLVCSKLRLVVRICRSYRGRGLPFEDLVNEGNLGLLEAAARFDPCRGRRFPAFAVLCIRRALLRALGDLEPQGATSPQSPPAASPHANRENAPPPAWPAASAHEDEGTADEMPAGEDGSPPDGADGPEVRFLKAETLDLIRRSVRRLDEPDRFVLMRRFGLPDGEPASLKAIAARLGVTPEMIRLIESRARRRVRSLIAGWLFPDRAALASQVQKRRRLPLQQPEQRAVQRADRP